MRIEEKLKETLRDIEGRLNITDNAEVKAQLLIAKTNVLLALQKYED